MKVICDRAALSHAVNLMSGVVAARTPRPQLTCVLLSAEKTATAGELTFSGTDGELSLRLRSAQVDVSQGGDILIPADRLRAIVSAEDTEQTLTLESEAEVAHIRGNDAHFKVYGFPAADFPPIPEFSAAVAGTGGLQKAKAVFTLTAGTLNAMIARTLFATARETSRYAINGVLMKRDGKKLEMVATDGRRLARVSGNIQTGDKAAAAAVCIIPTKTLALVQKLIANHEEPVSIAITENQVLFSFGDETDQARGLVVSNLVEGTFPPYEEVIPKDQDKRVVCDRDVLASAVRRAALLTNEESKGVKMKFNAASKQIELTSRAPEMGEANITCDLADYQGETIEIGFNPVFIVDALKVINDPQVILELKAANKPGLIRSGTDFQYVVMPVNLQ